MELRDDANPSDNIKCSRCSSLLPPRAKFCSTCGERIKKKKNEAVRARPETGDNNALEQEVSDDKLLIPSVSRAHLKGIQSRPPVSRAHLKGVPSRPSVSRVHLKSVQFRPSFKSNGINEQTYQRSSLPPFVGAANVVELPTQSLAVPDIETKKHDSIVVELPTQSLAVPDIETKKHDSIPLSQHLEQQVTRLLSGVNAAYQHKASTTRSNSSSILKEDTLVETAKYLEDMEQVSDDAPEFPMLSNKNGLTSGAWGWLPVLSLTSAIGLFLVAMAYNAGRFAEQWAEPLFWFGLVVIFLPIAIRLFSKQPTRQERITLLIIMAISLYFVKFLQYPLYFAYYDEFSHVQTAQSIAATGHLFYLNPILPISSFYPGLEIATNALSSLTGLSIFVTGIVLIGVARLVIVLALYLFYEQISKSMWVAGIATLLYMANPNFLFFDSMFSYESLAISLAVFVLFAVVRRSYVPANQRLGLTLTIWLGIGAVMVTHHVTSFILVAFLLLWTAVFFLLLKVPFFRQSRHQKIEAGPGNVALVGLVLCVAWLIYTGGQAVEYLSPHLTGAMNQFIQILSRNNAPRQFFHSSTSVTPLWERMSVYVSLILILLGLAFGLFYVWRRYRTNAAAFAMAVAVVAFPVSLALLLTQTGAELADRSTEFLFVAIAFVLALGASRFLLSATPSWRRSLLFMGAVTVLFVGQTIMGNGQSWGRMPGPYLVSADQRSIEPEGIAAAEWAAQYLGPGHVVATDRINTLLMATFGRQLAETSGSAKIPVSWVLLSPQFGPGVKTILQQDGVQYLVVDLRLSTALPQVGTYFNNGEVDAQHYTSPIDPAALLKFDDVQNVNRIFDSGNIIIYNVERVARGSTSTSTINLSGNPYWLGAFAHET
jgi:hypothetical protein